MGIKDLLDPQGDRQAWTRAQPAPTPPAGQPTPEQVEAAARLLEAQAAYARAHGVVPGQVAQPHTQPQVVETVPKYGPKSKKGTFFAEFLKNLVRMS